MVRTARSCGRAVTGSSTGRPGRSCRSRGGHRRVRWRHGRRRHGSGPVQLVGQARGGVGRRPAAPSRPRPAGCRRLRRRCRPPGSVSSPTRSPGVRRGRAAGRRGRRRRGRVRRRSAWPRRRCRRRPRPAWPGTARTGGRRCRAVARRLIRRALAGAGAASGRPDGGATPAASVSSARCSRARRATVVRANSRAGKFHEKCSAPSDSQHSRPSRVAAEAVPRRGRAHRDRPVGVRGDREAGEAERPPGPPCAGRAPSRRQQPGDVEAGEPRVPLGLRPALAQPLRQRGAPVRPGRRRTSTGRVSASGPTSRSMPGEPQSRGGPARR